MKIFLFFLALVSLACMESAAVARFVPTLSVQSVMLADGEVSTPFPVVQERRRCAVVTAEQALHVRYQAGAEADVLGYFFNGDQVEVLRSDGGWLFVYGFGLDASRRSNANLSGWVNGRYLRMGECQ